MNFRASNVLFSSQLLGHGPRVLLPEASSLQVGARHRTTSVATGTGTPTTSMSLRDATTTADTCNDDGGENGGSTGSLSLLRNGIDEGPATTARGRLKRNREDEQESDLDSQKDSVCKYKDSPEFPFKQPSFHIRRAFDLYGILHNIINDGIKRQARQEAGEDYSVIQNDRDYETYMSILDHVKGLAEEIVRLQREPLAFRRLIRKMKTCADNARNNDTAGLKKDVQFFLTPDGGSVLKGIKPGQMATSKIDRGFNNDVMGRYLCPVTLDWDDEETRQKIRDGKIAITAKHFPRLLYADCMYNPEDVEDGLARNTALLKTVKYIFTGRSSAFSNKAGGKTTRAGNAQIAGLKAITPRIVAYGACMLRFALCNQDSWVKLDGEFNMEEFYWNVVGIFENSGDFGTELLAWWNRETFGASIVSEKIPDEPQECSLSLLKAQREAKRRRILECMDLNACDGTRMAYPTGKG